MLRDWLFKTSRAKGLAVTETSKTPPVALGNQYVIKYNLLPMFARNTVSKEVRLRVSNVSLARQHKTTTDRQD